MIRILDSFISDKIAAGEVIERPVSIVKELVENSIDAGSTSIIVEIRNGGKSYIRVTDNGSGIPSDELSTAFLRHATSKISSVGDLDNIASLGFRGEALASIAAVSRITAVSRTEHAVAGTKMILHGGVEISTESVGTNVGTTIVVEDVFYNTPARRKFLGSDAREATVIIELIEQLAIYYAGIRFMLVNNGVTVFTTSGDGNNLNAITSIFPTKEFSRLIPIASEHINGYISDPGTTKSSRRGQLFFVNGRLVNSKVIEKGIEKGYGDRIFSGYPIAFLFLNIDPTDLDVNIHPSKKEIKFLNEDIIIKEIESTISAVMDTKESIPKPIIKSYEINDSFHLKEDNKISYNTTVKPLEIREYLGGLNREIYSIKESIEPPLDVDSILENAAPDKPLKPSTFDFSELKYAGYLFNSYIILQSDDAVYILDQHAAHERIFYESFINNYRQTENPPQPILTNYVINVSADVYSRSAVLLPALRQMGYDISDFGPNTFVVKGIPLNMTLDESELFARSFIESSDEFVENSTVIDKLIMKSCKSAVKANNRLSEIEIKELIFNLAKCDNPFSCPHGRPTFIKYTKYEIERSFKRK